MEASEASPPAWSPQDGGETLQRDFVEDDERWGGSRQTSVNGAETETNPSTLCVQVLKKKRIPDDEAEANLMFVDAAIKEIHQLRLFYYLLTAERTGGQSFTDSFGIHFIYCPPFFFFSSYK